MTGSGTVRATAHAVVAWLLVASLALAGVGSVFTGSLVWGAFVVVISLVASLPALARGRWRTTVPVPLLALAAIAALARAVGVYSEHAGYLAIVALALIVVVELDVFTPVELSRRFGVAFAVMLTLAFQAVWIVTQHLSDSWLGTALIGSQTELQWDIVAVTVVAVPIGVFYLGVARRVGSGGVVSGPDGQSEP